MPWTEAEAPQAQDLSDPVSEAVQIGLARGPRGGEKQIKAALNEAKALLAQARKDKAFKSSLPRALQLVRDHPGEERLQLIAGRLIAEGAAPKLAFDTWSGMLVRFPDAVDPFRLLVRLINKRDGEDAAEAYVRRRFPDIRRLESETDLLAAAAAEEELGRHGLAEDCLRRTTRLYPQSEAGWRRLAELQRSRGGLLSAEKTLAEAATFCPTRTIQALHAEIAREVHAIESMAPDAVHEDDETPVSLKAMIACIETVKDRYPRAAPQPTGVLGSVILVTGSLGPGGAERQLVATALALEGAIEAGESVAGYALAGPVSVAVRSLAGRRQNDFFLSTLIDGGVRVIEYSKLEPYGGDLRQSRLAAFSAVLDLLPRRMREGVTQLVEHFRYEAPDVVHIWQDGMVFAAGLAALIAGVPRIVLSARTLPPIDRIDRDRVELEPLYRALLSMPGVALTSNSAIAARRYEHWLDLPPGSVAVVHNGVAEPPSEPSEAEEAAWAAFLDKTADADFTVGCVMRMDENKRPLEWLMAAERLFSRHPASRFVLVGGGDLQPQAQELAARLGLRDRVLFTDRTASVGWWLARMDAFLLMSRFEGTPNVLIEAQLLGVPVVTTPAGGAAETLIPGVTGQVLSNAERPDLDEVADALLALADAGPGRRAEMGARARAFAAESYSVDAMLHQSLDVFLAPMPGPLAAARTA